MLVLGDMIRDHLLASPVTGLWPYDSQFRLLLEEEIPDLIRTRVSLIPEAISEIRVVNIEGIDQQADGGTHVANTREVGRVRIAGSENKGKGNKRLQIVLE